MKNTGFDYKEPRVLWFIVLCLILVGVVATLATYYNQQASLAEIPKAENLRIDHVRIIWKNYTLTGIGVKNIGSTPTNITKITLFDGQANYVVYSSPIAPPVTLNAGEVKTIDFSYKLRHGDYTVRVFAADGSAASYDFSVHNETSKLPS